MELLGLILGILALVLAIWHLREIKLQARELKTQANTLEQTQRSLSTRYIGEFPDYIPEIVDLIENARKEVLIFCDFPAYGHFSNHATWLNYRHAIELKSLNQVRLSLMCLTEGGRYKLNHEQFSKAEQGWEEWKREQKVRDQIHSLLQSHKCAKTIDEISREEFVNLLEETNKQMLNGALARAETLEVDGYMPLYFWLVDKKEAIFAIPSFSGEHTEYGFSTSDPKLISAFVEMRERYYRGIVPDGRLAEHA